MSHISFLKRHQSYVNTASVKTSLLASSQSSELKGEEPIV